jgi:hypothetical protein
MVANPDKKPENPEKKQSWLLTLPGILTATAALVTAIGGILTVFNPFSQPTGTTSPPPPQATVTTQMPPRGVNTTSLLPGADWQGWLDEPAARCREQDRAVAIGRTELESKLVICDAPGPSDLYYFRAVRGDGPSIELFAGREGTTIKRNEGGFDVTTKVDGTIWERRIRNDKFMVLLDGKPKEDVQWLEYTSL